MLTRLLAAVLAGISLYQTALAETTSVDGVDIYWTADGAGPAVILIHGWTCDTTVWEDQITALKSGYRVIALDLPGHGLSGSPENGEFTMALYAGAVDAVRAAAGVEKAVVVGHSMGAAVIGQYALDYSDHVAGVVAVDGDLAPNFPDGGPEFPEGTFRELREQLITGFFVPQTTPLVRDKVLHVMLAPPDERAIAVASAMGSFSRESGEQIAAPTLSVLAGTQDDPDEEAMRALRDLAPNIEVTRIARTGHFLMMEEPEVFNYTLRNFLEAAAY